jgi:integrase
MSGLMSRRGKMLGDRASWGAFAHLLGRSVSFWRQETHRLYVQAKLGEEGRLCPLSRLREAVTGLLQRMAIVGLVSYEPPWVTRLDVAVDGRCSPADGKLLLDALEACRLPNGWRTHSVGVPRSTVYFRDDCRTFLDKWLGRSPSTVASIHSALNGLFSWLYLESEIEHNPMTRVARPRRPRPEDLNVVIVTPADVERMLAATQDWQEFLCLTVLAYTGVRRGSASGLRWRDVDLDAGTIRVVEKGSKTAVKPVSNELLEILNAARESGTVDCRGDAYLIPNRRAASVRRKERSDKVIWETVKKVAKRVGVTANVHALRRAFAVAFLTSHPGALESLQALMNHSRIDTTQVYLRALNRSKVMEAVRDLSWGSVFPSLEREAHTGFEPVPPP